MYGADGLPARPSLRIRTRSSSSSAVFAGGCLGALARAGLAEAFAMPWGTLVANVCGSFLLGYVAARSPRFWGTGFCGALTTFSTFQVELLELQPGWAVVYAVASLTAGYAALMLGRR